MSPSALGMHPRIPRRSRPSLFRAFGLGLRDMLSIRTPPLANKLRTYALEELLISEKWAALSMKSIRPLREAPREGQ